MVRGRMGTFFYESKMREKIYSGYYYKGVVFE